MADVNPTAAILYGAKSTKDEKGSIPTQLADGRALAGREGWVVVAAYSDEDASAYKGNRGDGLAQAKAHAESIPGSVLVVQHTDRLARGDGVTADHLVELALWARRAGVRIASVQDPGTCDGGLAFAAMMGDRNHEDSRRKGEAVKSGMARRASTGLHNGGPPKYGFEYVRDEYGRTVPDKPRRVVPAEAAIVLRIFSDYAAGVSQTAIQRRLTAEGITTTRGTAWHQGTISKLLKDPQYAGCVFDSNEDLIAAPHEAIVPLELWRRVRTLREASAGTPSKGRGRRPNGRHLFLNGHLRCGLCGGAMVPRSDPDAADSYFCYTRKRLGPDACGQPPVKRAEIDGAVFDYFQNEGLDIEATRRGIADGVERAVSEIRELRAQAERDAQRATERLVRVKRDYMDGALSAADWQTFRDELMAEQEAATAKLAQLEGQEVRVKEEAQRDTEAEALRHLAAIREAIIGTVRGTEGVETLRAALLELFERFTLRRLSRSERLGIYSAHLDGMGIADRDVHPEALHAIGPDAGFELVPHVRKDAIAGYGPRDITPRPVKIPLRKAQNNLFVQPYSCARLAPPSPRDSPARRACRCRLTSA